jgi:hypothetical protein
MPLTVLQYKIDRGLKELAEKLAETLPSIVAPNLSLSERDLHDGKLTPDEIMVWCRESKKADQNGKDLEIIVFAHDFPERRENLEARKDTIIEGVRKFLSDYDRNVTAAVWVLLAPTAYGEI